MRCFWLSSWLAVSLLAGCAASGAQTAASGGAAKGAKVLRRAKASAPAQAARAADAPAQTPDETTAETTDGQYFPRLEQNRLLLGQLMISFRQRKNTLKPGDPRAAQLEAMEPAVRGMFIAGKTGEARRMLYAALALLNDVPWTPRDDYWRSLVVRTDMAVCDPARSLIAQLGQIYATTYTLQGPLTARALLLRPASSGRRPDAGPVAKELGRLEGLPSDLIDQPFAFAVKLNGVEEGAYLLALDLNEGDKPLHRLTTPLFLVKGLASTEEDIERRLAAIEGYDDTKASIRYPFDFALRVNLGQFELAGYDLRVGIKQSLDLLAALESAAKEGRDPLAGATGDLRRHYYFKEAGEIMPYRLYVPKAYDGSKPFPLIVALHGHGGTENVLMDVANGAMKRLAEQHGYIVVTPLGYRRDGGYGRVERSDSSEGGGFWMADPARERAAQLSELDVLNVLARVRAAYRIDDKRIYLMGHSMGGGGTWRLGAKHAGTWAALAPIAAGRGLDSEIDFERIRRTPVFVAHGDADPIAPVEASRAMVARMKQLGMTYEYYEQPGGTHAMVPPSLPKVFEFFDRHRRGE